MGEPYVGTPFFIPLLMLIYNVRILNEGEAFDGAVNIEGQFIKEIFREAQAREIVAGYQGEMLNGEGAWLMPGLIDDQVHFREPGLTYKADLFTESRAAAAGGITSFMEMPNTSPQTLSQDVLQAKFDLAEEKSLVNYSFYLGASNDNIEEIRKTDPKTVCGIKVFMGASTGNMLVDDPIALERIFAEAPTLVAIHSEDETIIRENLKSYTKRFGDQLAPIHHAGIRSREACIRSTDKALRLAHLHNTQLHILHLSTSEEASMLERGPLEEKKISAEVCVHHLWFSLEDYKQKGNLIKWNPSIKEVSDRQALRAALIADRIDVVATDHAPHTLEEKNKPYATAPSGGPLVQHSLLAMLEMTYQGVFDVHQIVEKMCHAPARLFRIDKRGFIREGYFADLILVRKTDAWMLDRESLLYKCKWSPFEGQYFQTKVEKTWVNGALVYSDGKILEEKAAMRLLFNR